MYRIVLALAAAGTLAACATVNPETPPGASYAINCPNTQLQYCFAKAKELCPSGYEVLQVRRSSDPIMMALAPDRVVVKCQGQ